MFKIFTSSYAHFQAVFASSMERHARPHFFTGIPGIPGILKKIPGILKFVGLHKYLLYFNYKVCENNDYPIFLLV